MIEDVCDNCLARSTRKDRECPEGWWFATEGHGVPGLPPYLSTCSEMCLTTVVLKYRPLLVRILDEDDGTLRGAVVSSVTGGRTMVLWLGTWQSTWRLGSGRCLDDEVPRTFRILPEDVEALRGPR